MSLSQRKIVITGASGGIGEAIVHELVSQGAQLLLCGRNIHKLEQKFAPLLNQDHQLFSGDLTDIDTISAFTKTCETFGVDTVINCVGINKLQTFSQSSAQDAAQTLAANLLTPINICHALLPQLHKQPLAVIVNIGSILGSIGYPGSTLYCASKFGLRGFSEALRRELFDSQIKVLYFAPRATATALNTGAMAELNRQLGNTTDTPKHVAKQLCQKLKDVASGSCYLGWPEGLFVRINALLPTLVDNAILKQLPIIKRLCHLKTTPQLPLGERHETP